ncbi:MAG: phosphoribosylaminoimidazolesuccinocarboxamide synthase [bacterium]
MDYQEIIQKNLKNCTVATNLQIGEKRTGKVRDIYDIGDGLAIVSCDRQSAFDRILASIPFKGQVLNQISAWWFKKTSHIVPNHMVAVINPITMLVKKCEVFPVEFVVRGYLTGTTSTSSWVNYQNGVRNLCGNPLPDNMKKNEKFGAPIVTPTTKSDEHDKNISGKEIVESNLMSQSDWNYCHEKALELFRFGQAESKKNGLILVDTKYEFGRDASGAIVVIDEIHTPDSSRFWLSASYEERIANGIEPENIDKEFLRLWFKQNCDPYNDEQLPNAPENLVIELSKRYILLYEMITGLKFEFANSAKLLEDTESQIKNHAQPTKSSPQIHTDSNIEFENKTSEQIQPIADSQTMHTANNADAKNISLGTKPLVGIIMGSFSDLEVVKPAIQIMEQFGIPYEKKVVSAHRTPDLMYEYAKSARERGLEIIIACAGGAAHLPGVAAALTDLPVIGIPRKLDALQGLDSLLSMVQMPKGVPVATVGIDNSKNAGLLAARILSIKYSAITDKLSELHENMKMEIYNAKI